MLRDKDFCSEPAFIRGSLARHASPENMLAARTNLHDFVDAGSFEPDCLRSSARLGGIRRVVAAPSVRRRCTEDFSDRRIGAARLNRGRVRPCDRCPGHSLDRIGGNRAEYDVIEEGNCNAAGEATCCKRERNCPTSRGAFVFGFAWAAASAHGLIPARTLRTLV